MKRWIMGVGVVVVVFAVTAHAAETGYNGGFFIKSDDEAFKLKINGSFQPRFTFNRSNATPKTLSWSIRRTNMMFGATIHEKVSFNIGLAHGTNSKNFTTLNVIGGTAGYAAAPQFNITAGMVGLPLDMISEVSSSWYVLPEPPITLTQSDGSSEFTATRDSFGSPDGLGVNFSGDIGKFFYSTSVVNGSESNYAPNPDMRMSFGGRVGVNIIGGVGGSLTDFAYSADPNLTVSAGSIYQGRRADTAFADACEASTGAACVAPVIDYIWTSSAGTALRWRGFAIQGEVYYRNYSFESFGDLPAQLQDPDLTDFAYYGTVGYYVIPKKLEITTQAGQVFREGPDNNANQFGGGLNYYIQGNNLKLMVGYIWSEDYDDVAGLSNNNTHTAIAHIVARF